MMVSLINRFFSAPALPAKVLPPSTFLKPGHSLAQYCVFQALKKIQVGELSLSIDHKHYCFGTPDAALPCVKVRIHRASAFSKILTRGSIGVAESYIDGDWSTDQLTELCQLFLKNLDALQALNHSLSWAAKKWQQLQHFGNRNTHRGSKDNIAAHYDLSNDLFQTFLDATMMYSSGVFHSPNDTLHKASVQKLDRVCEWLELNSDHHVLEIGTGWGSMAIHAAKTTGCKVTTTTISQEQYEHAKERVKQEGLEGQVTVLLKDYRDLSGQYDKLISIEMMEAVGQQFLPGFFQQCQRLLKPAGDAFIQCITIAEHRAAFYQNNVDFIQTHIFPGGYLPSNQQIYDLQKQETSWALSKVSDVGLDYAKTLAFWHQNFIREDSKITELGFDQAFKNMWRYYLNYCEAGFREQQTHCMQFLFTSQDQLTSKNLLTSQNS